MYSQQLLEFESFCTWFFTVSMYFIPITFSCFNYIHEYYTYHSLIYAHSKITNTNARTQVSNVVSGNCAGIPSGETCEPYDGSGSRSRTYDCASGYDPSGDATCSLGSWSGGSCVDGSCKSNPGFANFDDLVPNGNDCTLEVPSGTTCAFTCAPGYTATGT